jgi:hypothetical protein
MGEAMMSYAEHTHVISGVTIHTEFVYPPIPSRASDWRAVTDDYDCDCDENGYFSRDPVGYGRTEKEAIDDLCAQIQERGK